jgi:hemolysin activation/secretion protein
VLAAVGVVWMLSCAGARAQAPILPQLPPGAIAPLAPPPQRVLPVPQPEIVPPAPPPSEPAPPPLVGAPIHVDAIRLEGVTVYDQAALRASFADAIGTDVPRARLDDIVQSLQTRYREDGYILTLVRAHFERAPHGTVFVIQAVEGYISAVKLDSDVGPVGDLILRTLDNLTAKHPLNNADLERYVLLANDIPGMKVSAVLRPTEGQPGAVELVAQVARKPYSVAMNYDNRGPQQAGPSEILVSGATNSFTSAGERIEAMLYSTFNNEELFGQVNGDAILNGEGLKLHTYFGRGNNQPGGSLEGIGLNSDLTIGGASLIYPLIRSRRFNIYIDTDTDTYQSTLTIGTGDAATENGSHLLMQRFGASVDLQDVLIPDRPAANAINIKVSHGLGGTSNTRPGNNVNFTKVAGDMTRVQDLFTFADVRTALKVSVGGQFTNDILPPSEKYYLGGTRFGRGFYNGEVTGDRAIGSTTELQFNTTMPAPGFLADGTPLPAQFYGFWDFGHGYNLAPGDQSFTIQSLGLGVRSDVTPWLSVELEGVHRLTTQPQGPDVTAEAPYAFFTRVTAHY